MTKLPITGNDATCYIHVGMPKTGTTTIQSALRHSRKSPDFRYLNLGHANHSRAMIAIFSKTPGKYSYFRQCGGSTEEFHRYAAEMRALLEKELGENSRRKFIISGESIMGLMEDELKDLYQLVGRHFTRIHIIAYIRPPISYMESIYQQKVKGGNYQASFEDSYPFYARSIRKFDDVFGRENVILRKFEPAAFPKQDIVHDFCQLLGIDLPDYQSLKSNESLSMEATALLLAYWEFGGKFESGESGKSAILKKQEMVKALGRIPGRKLRFSGDMVSAVIAENRQDIEWIEHRAGFLIDSMRATDSSESVSNKAELISYAMEGARKLMDALGVSFTTTMPSPQTPQEAARVLQDFVDAIDTGTEANSPKSSESPCRVGKRTPWFGIFRRLRSGFKKSKPD